MPAAWVEATAVRSELGVFPGRNPVRPRAGVECAQDVYRQANISVPRQEIDVAELYDCFSSSVLFAIEGLGLAERGGAGDWVRAGSLPFNTNGGLLSEGYIHGMNTVAEAVLQVQGRGGANQVPRHEVCAVTSGAMMDGSALILTADR